MLVFKKYLPLFLSAIWPGLGQIYLKKYRLGIIYFLVWLLLLSLFLQTFPLPVLMGPARRHYTLIFASVLIFWLAVLWESYQVLKKQKQLNPATLPLITFFLIILIYIYLCLPFAWRPFKSGKKNSIGNLHTHTTCSDGIGTYEEIISLAQKLNFDFLALTDHRLLATQPCTGPGTCDDNICQEILQKCANEKRVLCIHGQELDVSRGAQILALGIKSEIDGGQPTDQVIKEIHKQGGIAIAAHPWQEQTKFTEDELINSNFDAMECGGGSRRQNAYFADLSKKQNIPCVYDSDTHEIGMLRRVYNICNQEINTFADLKNAIAGNNCRRFMPLDARLLEILAPYYWF